MRGSNRIWALACRPLSCAVTAFHTPAVTSVASGPRQVFHNRQRNRRERWVCSMRWTCSHAGSVLALF
jgi:hypothetical protein